MGKHTDKLYITAAEWTSEFGGLKKAKTGAEFKKLPFSCCALTFTPYSHPVCTTAGIIFEIEHIVPWLKKHGTNPVTGDKLESKDLIKLNISKNANGEYQCPITFKTFNDHSHILAIKTSGNVYSYDAIEELNIKPKYWKDLLTDEKFTRRDIITLQDPHNFSGRNMLEFDFVQKGIKVPDSKATSHNAAAASINEKGTTATILREISKATESKEDLLEIKKHNQAHYSTGLSAYSTTSTAFTPSTKTVAATISNDDYLIGNIKEKSIVQLQTNLGDITFELHCNEAPRTCYNFVQLCHNGYYDMTKFHRLIKNFMIQGGDPTGTGSGGTSIWNKKFSDEIGTLKFDQRGLLAMANNGPNTNGSQFFITFTKCPHLDDLHTIFGRMTDGDKVLHRLESIGTNEDDIPLENIIIMKTKVVVDSFDLLLHQDQHKKAQKQERKLAEDKLELLKKRALGTTSSTDDIGKFLKKRNVNTIDFSNL